MKLCIITPNVIKGDGQGRANYEITWEAIRRGHHVTLLAGRVVPELQQNSQVSWIPVSSKSRIPTQLLGSIYFYLKSAHLLRQHQHEFDLIQVYGGITSIPGDVNTIQFVHTAWLRSSAHISRVKRNLYGAYQWLYSALHISWEKKLLPQAEVVVAVSEKIKDELVNLIGVPEERISVILNGVDLDEFFPGSADRKTWGLPENVPLALFVGDIRLNRKNLDTVLHALTQVPGLHLAVVGATEGSPYPRLSESLGLSERVHFLGYRRDVADIMKAADFFVFPSRYEACTLALLEALASGLPVITAVTAGGAEVVTPDCGVVLPDSEDREALVEAMNSLTNDPDRRGRMSQGARLVAEQHSWVSKAQSYLNLFERVAKEKSSNINESQFAEGTVTTSLVSQ
jgi:glycosyltransferase involved in cell wall biosynthesis